MKPSDLSFTRMAPSCRGGGEQGGARTEAGALSEAGVGTQELRNTRASSFPDCLDEDCGRKGRGKDDLKVFGLNI